MTSVPDAVLWTRWQVRGSDQKLDALVRHLNEHLPAGWAAGDEHPSLLLPGVMEPTYFSPDADGVSVSLIRRQRGLMRGGYTTWWGGDDTAANARAIEADFVRRGVRPAAESVGLRVEVPTDGELFDADVPADTLSRLRDFSDPARKVLPLDRAEAERWHEFVIAAHRDRRGLNTDGLTSWLEEHGWASEAAADLAERLWDQQQLLSRYADAVLSG